MTDYPNSTITIPYTDPNLVDEDGNLVSPELSIELDEDKHEEVYEDASRSVFYAGERSYFKVFFDGAYRMHLGSSAGSLRDEHITGIEMTVEAVKFQNSSTAQLSKKPSTVVSYSWINDGPTMPVPLFNGRTITLSKPALGVLICSFGIQYKRISLLVTNNDFDVSNTLPVIVHCYLTIGGAIFEDDQEHDYESVAEAFAEVTYHRTRDEAVETYIQILDYATNSAVAGASVSINGVSAGTTNSEGRLLFNAVPGTPYTIKTEADGYVDSDEDILDNESFIIPIT